MDDANRRDFIKTAGLELLASTLSASTRADTPAVSTGPAYDATQSPIALPFDPKSLKGISEKLIQSYW